MPAPSIALPAIARPKNRATESGRQWRTLPIPICAIMLLDLTDDETLALTRLLRRAIEDDRYPLSPGLAPLKAILAKLEPPAPRHERPPPLKAVDAPRQRRPRRG